MRKIRSKFRRSPPPPVVPVPSGAELSKSQRRRLLIIVVAAILIGIVLVWSYFPVIALAALAAVIFAPVYKWIKRHFHKPGTSATLTFIVMLLAVIIPVGFALFVTVSEIQEVIYRLEAVGSGKVSPAVDNGQLLTAINQVLDVVTRGLVQINAEQLNETLARAASELASAFLGLISASFGAITAVVTGFILFMYLFTALLTHGELLLDRFRELNPLGPNVASLYISRTGLMARGVVGGQFVIAAAQGIVEAGILYLAGIDYFFFFALLLTFLSVIPLGGGILTIPIGIILLLTGNVWQGLLILLGHFLIITNIDNVLRPRLIPRSIRMNPALLLLSVFGGLALFGFLGIFVGPILMILVLSTLEVFMPLARVYATADDDTTEGLRA